MRMFSNITFLSILFGLIIFPWVASAHLDGGEDSRIGNYYIDFGFKPEEIEAQRPAIFETSIVEWTTRISPENLSAALIRIERDSQELFSATLDASGGQVRMDYTFPRGGSYTYTVDFLDSQGALIVSSSYELEVTDSFSSYYSGGLILFIAESAALLIALAGLLYVWFYRKKVTDS